jgi:DNA processing protein
MQRRRGMMGGERSNRVLLALVTSRVIPARVLVELIRREGADRIEALGMEGLVRRYRLGPRAREPLRCAFERTPEIEKSLSDHGARAVWLGDDDYPALLSEIPVPPPALFVRGGLDARNTRVIAIVGSRRASLSGRRLTLEVAEELALRGFTVVSGLARGIDTAAHQGALAARGRTLAVLGSGIDLIYPPENRPLSDEISMNGALLSEHGPGVEPLPWHFPLRNRIISGLCMGTVVVEAAPRSGALITARCALEQNRSVFAVPGKPGDPRSGGVNKLLKDGAKLVENADDILEDISPQVETDLTGDSRLPGFQEMDGVEGRVMDLLSDVPTHVNDISVNVGIDTGEILGLLLTMETKGLVKSLPGKFYVRV